MCILADQRHDNLLSRSSFYWDSRRRLNPWEVANHEEQVHEPEAEPDRRDGLKPNQEEDQTRPLSNLGYRRTA